MDLIEISNIENVHLADNYDSSISVEGKIHVTVTHLIFQSNNHSREIWILIHLIASVDSPMFSSMGKVLVIKCKDFHVYRFSIEDSTCCEKLKAVIIKLVGDIDQHYKLPCFNISPNKQIAHSIGWESPSVRLKKSFARMGLPNSQWKITDINIDHKISDTYPAVLVVPEITSISIMKACSKFRSRGRLPALTYFHKETKSAMCRSSQPLVGFAARCNEDILMLKRIKDVAPEGHREVLHVIDTRPRINALTNKAKGKGFESEIDYEKIVFQFFDIENIHVMRSSLQKLLKACRNMAQSHSSYISAIEKSGWLKHIKMILDTSFSTAKKIQAGDNVLVHCSDGWDRTSQVCGLAQVILDPHYRTIEGLEELIEKDWLGFGHKFSDRCGHLSSIDPSEVAPVFTQFLDCLYQLTNFYPEQFEYNERLLRHICKWSQGCEFGTFVGNCEKDRIDLKVSELSPSVWGFIRHNLWDYHNPFYNINSIVPILEYSIPTIQLSIWMTLYCPNEDITSINACSVNTPDHIFTLQKLTKSIVYHNEHLLKRASQLMSMLSTKDLNPDSLGRLNSIKNRIIELEQTLVCQDGEPATINCKIKEETPDMNFDWTISKEISSVSNDCGVLRLQKYCYDCHTQFLPLLRKKLCFSCGLFFCNACASDKISLYGHGNVEKSFLVCKSCHNKAKEIQVNLINKTDSYNRTKICANDLRYLNGDWRAISVDPLLEIVQQQAKIE